MGSEVKSTAMKNYFRNELHQGVVLKLGTINLEALRCKESHENKLCDLVLQGKTGSLFKSDSGEVIKMKP